MQKWCIFILLLFFAINCLSQESKDDVVSQLVNRSTLIGLGKANITDTYLSPLEYSGMSISLLSENLKATHYFDGALLLQQQFEIQIAQTKNPAKSASAYYGDVVYGLNGYYPIIETTNFRLLGGGGWDLSVGGIYNERNTNNSGSIKLSTNLNVNAMALYNLRKFTFRWQLGTPFMGMFFSPEYGHSYYEIFSLGNSKGVVNFASFHNQIALRNYFTVDYPLSKITLRVGYLGDYYKTDINSLITNINSHQLMVGLVFESENLSGRKVSRSRSVYY
ncbi:MAG: DUF3316 domain-containing protein [Dysgonamonadaceae bacterium]|nr:DUF3316 domain-containing protein [Dysgonamonadaceae bacterium]MDD3900506.1 DUF3316 domain-containing protein [Dysgonamonadaceae bacterium]